ncbi:energy coupling factor transporter S component ThiW [Viridibacillus arvi]|uniref:energy coupling factor transporter S component ThiW n=1 Tax=Viridibacillus arvi TaxID=263475 RepID=UPI0034CFA4ED
MTSRKTAIAMFVTIAVAGSVFVSFPAGIARAYPIQHAVNVLAAVMLGPGPAVLIAFFAGLIRLITGTGSLLAFPGGMIGAFLAGMLYKHYGKVWLAAVGEAVGTGILASLVAVPYAKILMGTSFTALFFMPAFLVSSVSGALFGCIIAARLKETKFAHQLQKH